MKKEFLIIFLFFGLLIVFSISIFACTDDQRIMRISNTTNAHGEIYNGVGNYPVDICYNDIFGTEYTKADPHSCVFNGLTKNKIIGLSNLTNAHAEIPSLNNYEVSVCYGNLVCKSATVCDADEKCVVTLSNDTNAHLAICDSPDAYVTRICCKNQSQINPSLYWEDLNGNPDIDGDGVVGGVENLKVALGITKILLVFHNSDLAEGTSVNFSVYEEDLIFDDLIRTFSGVVDSNGNANATWTITQADIDATNEPTSFDNFYFTTNISGSLKSNELNITLINIDCTQVSDCGDYTTEEECGYDFCSVANDSVEKNNPGFTCGETLTGSDDCTYSGGCSCEWDNGICKPLKTDYQLIDCPSPGISSVIGTCLYNENSDDNCDDGFLSYSWTGSYIWDANNVNTTPLDNEDNWVEDPIGSGSWHYDPNGMYSLCIKGGSNTIICAVEAQLPFFNIYNIILGLLMVGITYWFLRDKKVLYNNQHRKKSLNISAKDKFIK